MYFFYVLLYLLRETPLYTYTLEKWSSNGKFFRQILNARELVVEYFRMRLWTTLHRTCLILYTYLYAHIDTVTIYIILRSVRMRMYRPPSSSRDRKQSPIPLASRHVYVRQRPYTMTAEHITIIIFVVIILT